MKLIFALILLVGIMAWFLMPTQPQNSTSSNQSSVQTNNTTSSPTSTGKAIWDGKLTYDINTVTELFDKPHSELSPEEAAIKNQYAIDISIQENDLSKYTECLSKNAKQRFQIFLEKENITTTDELKKYLEKSHFESLQGLSVTVIASTINEKTAKVALAFCVTTKPQSEKRAVQILELINTKKGWLVTLQFSDLMPYTYINDVGYCVNIFSISQDGSIIAINVKGKGAYIKGKNDIFNKNITVYDFLK